MLLFFMVYISSCGDSERFKEREGFVVLRWKVQKTKGCAERERESFRVFFGVLADRMVLVPTY